MQTTLDAQEKSTPRRRIALRTHLFVLCTIVLATLVAALRPAWLLGLNNRCAMQLLFHINCPFCGMTRDFVRIWHHQPPIHNPGSWPTALFIYVAYPILAGWAFLTRRPEIFQHPLFRRTVFVAIALLWVANNLST